MDDIKYEEISKKIREKRLILGYSQEYMAHQLNISQNVYSSNERNVKNVPLLRAIQILKILEIPILIEA